MSTWLTLILFGVLCAIVLMFAKEFANIGKKCWKRILLRHALIQIVLCTALVLTFPYVYVVLQSISMVYYKAMQLILHVIGVGSIRVVAAQVLSFLFFSLALSWLSSLIYWLARSKSFSYRQHVLWGVLLVLLPIVFLTR